MLSLDQVRALVSVADATRAHCESLRDHEPTWLRDIRASAFVKAVETACDRGVPSDQIDAISGAVAVEVLGLSSDPTTPA